MKKLLLSAAAFGFLTSAGTAHADLVNGPFTVTVYNGNSVQDTATQTLSAGTLSDEVATFTYTGPLDFTSDNTHTNGNDTFANFFGSHVSGISNESGPDSLATLLDLILSAPGFQHNSLFVFSGTTGLVGPGTTIKIGHDDGADLLAGTTEVIQAHGPTAFTTTTGVLPATSGEAFNLVYVSSNGPPSELVVTVPEPATLAIFGAGLLGLGMVRRRKQK